MTKKSYDAEVFYYPGGIQLRLFNFRINHWNLRSDHREALDIVAVPFLNESSDYTFALNGMTSRSGPEAYNVVLSEKRAEEVLKYLKLKHVDSQLDSGRTGGIHAGGEDAARTAGLLDNSEDPYYRAVEILLLKNVLRHRLEEFRFGIPLPEDYGLG